jgi:hypothetical protein
VNTLKWFALLGLVLFLGVAIAPNINANIKNYDVVESIIEKEQKYQRSRKLISTIIDYYKLTSEIQDCGCEDDVLLEHDFPILCRVLYPLFIISLILEKRFHIYLPYTGMNWIGTNLNCDWWNSIRYNITYLHQ